MKIKIDNKNFFIPDEIVSNYVFSIIKVTNQILGTINYCLLISDSDQYRINEVIYNEQVGLIMPNLMSPKWITTGSFIEFETLNLSMIIIEPDKENYEEENVITVNENQFFIDAYAGDSYYELKYNSNNIYNVTAIQNSNAENDDDPEFIYEINELYRYSSIYNNDNNFKIKSQLAYDIVDAIKRVSNNNSELTFEESISVLNNSFWYDKNVSNQSYFIGPQNNILYNNDCKSLSFYPFAPSPFIGEIFFPSAISIESYSLIYSLGLRVLRMPELKYINFMSILASPITTFIAPKLTSIGQYGIAGTNLDKVNFPELKILSYFGENEYLKEAFFPTLETIADNALESNSLLKIVDLGEISNLEENTFKGCYDLNTIILRNQNQIVTFEQNILKGLYPSNATEEEIGTRFTNFYFVVPESLNQNYKDFFLETTFNNKVKSLLKLDSSLYLEEEYKIAFNTTKSFCYDFLSLSDSLEYSVESSNPDIVFIDNILLEDNKIKFDINSFLQEGQADITIKINNNCGDEIEQSFKISVFENLPYYTVEDIENASYNFILNEKNYYQNTNQYEYKTYALSRIKIYTDREINLFIDCIDYHGASDYAIFSKVDQALSLSTTPDDSAIVQFTTSDNTNAYDIITSHSYGTLTPGEYFIDVKYRKGNTNEEDKNQKEGAVSSSISFEYEDLFQFKIRMEEITNE